MPWRTQGYDAMLFLSCEYRLQLPSPSGVGTEMRLLQLTLTALIVPLSAPKAWAVIPHRTEQQRIQQRKGKQR